MKNKQNSISYPFIDEILKNPPIIQSGSSFYGFRSGFFGIDIKFDRKMERAALVKNGDIFLLNIKSGSMTQITDTHIRESNAQFTQSGEELYFTSEDNLFLLSLRDASIKQMTSFMQDSPPEQRKPDDIQMWYSRQQKELFREFSSQRREGMTFPPFSPQKKIKPFHLNKNQNIYFLCPAICHKDRVYGNHGFPRQSRLCIPEHKSRNC